MLNKDIHTKRTLLRKYQLSDKAIMIRLFMDEVVGEHMGNGPCEAEADALALFNKIMQLYEKSPVKRHFEIWAITVDGQFAGHFELKASQHTDDNELEVVYMLDQTYWGKGLMPEILQVINLHAQSFDKQLIATINPDNRKTVRALEKTGIEHQNWIGEGHDRCMKVWVKRPDNK